MSTQIKYGNNYIGFEPTYGFNYPVYVCFQPYTSIMWMNTCDQEEIRSMQRHGVVYRKYKSPATLISMIMEFRPKSIDGASLLSYSDTPFDCKVIGTYKTEKPIKSK